MLCGVLAATLVIFMMVSRGYTAPDFTLKVSEFDVLLIQGADGKNIAEILESTVGKTIQVGATSFQVSYGRDLNDSLSVIVAPNISKPTALNFNVGDKSVQSDKAAIVTVTYSNDHKPTHIDPGFIGTVTIDGQIAKVPTAIPTVVAKSPVHTPVKKVAKKEVSKEPIKEVAKEIVKEPVKELAKETPKESTKEAPAKENKTAEASKPALAAPAIAKSPIGSVSAEWARPVSDAEMTAVANDTPTTLRLVQVIGNATVTDPTNNLKDAKVEKGMKVSSGAIVKTGADSSVAIIIGGVNTVRLTPKTEVQVGTSLENATRKTDVELKLGAIFTNVNKREGEIQDFQVRTSAGVASACGSAAGVAFDGKNMTIAAQSGTWNGHDSKGKPTFSITPKTLPSTASDTPPQLTLAVAAAGPMPAKQLIKSIKELLNMSAAVDKMIAALLAKEGSPVGEPMIVVFNPKDALTSDSALLAELDFIDGPIGYGGPGDFDLGHPFVNLGNGGGGGKPTSPH